MTTALANAPALSNLSAPILIACVVKAFYVEVGIKVSNNQIKNVTPSRSYLPTLQNEHLIDTLALLRKMVKNAKIFGAFDGANKGIHHVVKGVSFWDKKK